MHWDGFLEWLFDFEYKKDGDPGARTPVVYLSVEVEVSQRLIAERYHGDTNKMDIQEKDIEYLARSRAAAEILCPQARLGADCLHQRGKRSTRYAQRR